MAKLLVLHGPNLNLLGTREQDHYGAETLDAVDARLRAQARTAGHELATLQSNAEHVLVDAAQQAGRDGVAFMIVNPAAFTHTSVALRDALLAAEVPFIEVHVSNVYAREAFRRHSYFSDVAQGVIAGLGARGYELALTEALRRVDASNQSAQPECPKAPSKP